MLRAGESSKPESYSQAIEAPPEPPRGWYSRGYLPHLDTPGLIQTVGIRLTDSLPRDVLDQLYAETRHDELERLRRIEHLLDTGRGACWLARPEIAGLVEHARLHFDGTRYRLLAWTVMPNHVHFVLETRSEHPLFRVIQGLKSYTALRANGTLGRTGNFWARDDFDRYVRDALHLAAMVRYIDNNPVKAGLVSRPEDWPFGSARRCDRGSADL